MDLNEGFQLDDLRGVLRRRQGVITLIFGAVFLSSIFVAAVLPNEYRSSAVLMIEPQRISERLVGSSQSETDLTHRLNLMAMEILSRARLSRIIDDLGLYPEESKEMTREEVIEIMRSDLSVVPVVPELEAENAKQEEIDTFQISFRADAARTAADVTNRLANDFVEEHIKARTQASGETSEFLQSELTRVAGRIQEVEERIAIVKGENTGSLPEHMGANQLLRQRLSDNMRDAERVLTEAEGDAAFYGQQVLASNTLVDTRVSSPEQRMQNLELRIAELSARGFTDKHPDVVTAKLEIEQLRGTLGDGDDSSEGEGGALKSMAQRNAESEKRRAELRAESARLEISRLRAEIGEIDARIADTPRVAERLESLEREHEHLADSYQTFSQKRLDAAVSANIERQVKGERFRVLESAVPDHDPVSPQRAVILVLGALLGLGLGVGLAIMLEALDSSFRSVPRLQAALQIPVLAAIPEIVLEQDRKRRRRRRLRNLALASAATMIVLAGSGAGYLFVNGVPAPLQELTGGESAEPQEPDEG
jgi:polysaccharide chain length determinant protein (PEP-CTERM system associated)